MANTKKVTKKEYFGMLRELVADNAELTAFIDHEVELLNKKSNKSGATKTQKENEGTKAIIVEVLGTADKMTITEMQNANEELKALSNQKISALLTQLVNAKQVKREKDKKTTYFKLIAE